MTPSNQHSAEELLGGLRIHMLGTTDGDFIYPDSELPVGEMYRLAAEYLESVLAVRTHTDRETAKEAIGRIFGWQLLMRETPHHTEPWIDELKGAIADAILADPRVRLVGAREEIARGVLGVAPDFPLDTRFARHRDALAIADRLLSSGVITEASEVEAAALEDAADEVQPMTPQEPLWVAGYLRQRAARIRSGKAEA